MKVKDYIIMGLILVIITQSYFNPKLSESRFNDALSDIRVLILEQERNSLKINLIQLEYEKDSVYSYIDSIPVDSLHVIYPDIIKRLYLRDSLRRLEITTENR